MKGYKGFDKDMKCRGFQFEIGKKYEHEGDISLCNSGFHFCERPLDILDYYPPNCSHFAIIEADEESKETSDDSKRVAKKISIITEITLQQIIDDTIKYVFERSKLIKGCSATGDRGAASATGYSGAASATGDRGAASATGDRGAASATGVCGAASATGDRGAASATGVCGAASATGVCGAASATGDRGAASATGVCGAASATGDRGAASATGDRGAASATGDRGAASATGKHSVACGLGVECMAMGSIGSWIVLAARELIDNEWVIKSVKTAKVDDKKIKANVFYIVKNGKFVEAK
jgi:hypothetical protein